MLGIYIGLSTGKEKPTTQNVSMAVPRSYCYPFFPDDVGTEDSSAEMSGLHYIQDFVKA